MQNALLKLPEKTIDEQRKNKLSWNQQHCTAHPDFYTIGYSGRSIDEFIHVLKNAGVATLADIRFMPLSRFRPEFSKNNLKNAVESEGIVYVHKPEWGVPREIRANSVGRQTREEIWSWYDSNVLPLVLKKNLHELLNTMEHPIAYMCVEYDPTECHRHRLFLGLERIGMCGCDL